MVKHAFLSPFFPSLRALPIEFQGDPITRTLMKKTRKVGKKREKPIGFQIKAVAVIELP